MAFDLKKMIPYGVLSSDKTGELADYLDVFGDYYDGIKQEADSILKLLHIDDCPPELLVHLAHFLRAEMFRLNLISNPTFDIDSDNNGIADGWSTFGGGTPTYSLIDRRHSKAQRCNTNSQFSGIRQSLSLNVGKRLIIRAKIRVMTSGAVLDFGNLGGSSIGVTYAENLAEWKTYVMTFTPGSTPLNFGVEQGNGVSSTFDVDDFFVGEADEIDRMKQWVRNCVSVYKKKGTKQALIDVIQYLTDWTPTVAESFMTKFFQVCNWPGSNDLNQSPVYDVDITNIDGTRKILTVSPLWGGDVTGQSNVGYSTVTNPSFEEVTTPPTPDSWTAVGSPTLAIVQGYVGKNAVRITPAGSGEGLKSTSFNLTGGSSYTFRAAVRKVSGSAPTIKIRNTTEGTDDIVLTLTDVTDEFLIFSATAAISGVGTKACEVQLLGNSGDVFEVDETVVKPSGSHSFDFWCWVVPDTLTATDKKQKNYVKAIDTGAQTVTLGEAVSGTWTAGRLKGMTWEMQSIESVIDAGAYYYFQNAQQKEVTITLGAPTDDARKEMLEVILLNYLPVGVQLTVQY